MTYEEQRAAEKITADAIRARFPRIAKALGWKFVQDKEDRFYCYFESHAGQRLYISGPSYSHKNAFHISGCYPQENGTHYGMRAAGHGKSLPSINVSITKSDEQVSKDIARRLIPVFVPIHTKALELQAADHAYKNAQKGLCAELSSVLKRALQPATQRESCCVSFHEDGKGYGDFTASNDTVCIKLNSLPREFALEVAALVSKHINA